MSKVFDNRYILVFLGNSSTDLILAFVKYALEPSHSKLCSFMQFLDAKKPCFVSRTTSKNQVRLTVESCLVPRWFAFLMLYPLIRTHFNELMLA